MTAIMPKAEVLRLVNAGTAKYCGDAMARSLIAAHDEIDNLRAEVERVQSDRQYVIGANDGWDEAVSQGLSHEAARATMVTFWKRMAETHNARADTLAADNARLAAQVEALTGAVNVHLTALTAYLHGLGTIHGEKLARDSLAAEQALRAAIEAATIAARDAGEGK